MIKTGRGTGLHSELDMRTCDGHWKRQFSSVTTDVFPEFLYPKSLHPGMDRDLGSTKAKSLLSTKDKMVSLELRFLSVGSLRESTGKGTYQLHL